METENRAARYRDADQWPTAESLAAMLDSQFAAFAAVRSALPDLARAVTAAADRLRAGGRLVYAGAGSSGRIAAQDGAELHPTFGWPKGRVRFLLAGGERALVEAVEGAEDDTGAATAAARALGFVPEDVLVAVAASGATRFTRAVQAEARERGALAIALANNPGAPLLAEAEIGILLHTGPEFLAGSTRMAAGTAQKIALNLLSTQIMIELGRVYQGLMAHVVPSNAKLVARSRAIAAALTGASPEEAAAAFEAAGRNLPLAVLLLDGLPRAEAEARLAAAGGDLRRARRQAR